MAYRIRPEGSTKKSYRWVCSDCGRDAYNIPGENPPGDYCPHCGKKIAKDDPTVTRFRLVGKCGAEDDAGDLYECEKCGWSIVLTDGIAPADWEFTFCPKCGRNVRC